jgi:hypothetical protein
MMVAESGNRTTSFVSAHVWPPEQTMLIFIWKGGPHSFISQPEMLPASEENLHSARLKGAERACLEALIGRPF